MWLLVCVYMSCVTHSLSEASSRSEISSAGSSGLTLTGSGADVGDEAAPAGVWLGRALLTGVAPGPADGGAAQRLGAHDPAQLALTHLVVHLRETRPGPVVCGREETGMSYGSVVTDEKLFTSLDTCGAELHWLRPARSCRTTEQKGTSSTDTEADLLLFTHQHWKNKWRN